MPVILAALFGFLGRGVSGLFSFKGDQAQTVQSALKVLSDVNATDGQVTVAASDAISSIMNNGSFLEKNWRPVFMIVCMVIIVCSFFGWVPPHLNDPVSPIMERVWTVLEIGLGGYMPLRTLEKIMNQLNIASIVKTLISKKVV